MSRAISFGSYIQSRLVHDPASIPGASRTPLPPPPPSSSGTSHPHPSLCRVPVFFPFCLTTGSTLARIRNTQEETTDGGGKWHSTLEILTVPGKVSHTGIPGCSNSTSVNLPRRSKDKCTTALRVASFLTAPNWKQPKSYREESGERTERSPSNTGIRAREREDVADSRNNTDEPASMMLRERSRMQRRTPVSSHRHEVQERAKSPAVLETRTPTASGSPGLRWGREVEMQ